MQPAFESLTVCFLVHSLFFSSTHSVVCPFSHLSVCSLVYLSISSSVCQHVCPFVCLADSIVFSLHCFLPTCRSGRLSDHLSVYLSILLSVFCPSVHVSDYLFNSPSVQPSFCPCLCLKLRRSDSTFPFVSSSVCL